MEVAARRPQLGRIGARRAGRRRRLPRHGLPTRLALLRSRVRARRDAATPLRARAIRRRVGAGPASAGVRPAHGRGPHGVAEIRHAAAARRRGRRGRGGGPPGPRARHSRDERAADGSRRRRSTVTGGAEGISAHLEDLEAVAAEFRAAAHRGGRQSSPSPRPGRCSGRRRTRSPVRRSGRPRPDRRSSARVRPCAAGRRRAARLRRRARRGRRRVRGRRRRRCSARGPFGELTAPAGRASRERRARAWTRVTTARLDRLAAGRAPADSRSTSRSSPMSWRPSSLSTGVLAAVAARLPRRPPASCGTSGTDTSGVARPAAATPHRRPGRPPRPRNGDDRHGAIDAADPHAARRLAPGCRRHHRHEVVDA